MAGSSGFFDATELADGTYDKTYVAEQFAKYFSLFVGNGVFVNPANQLKVVSANNGMYVTVSSGYAFINGYWFGLDTGYTFPIAINDSSTADRIDGIFLRLDLSEGKIDVVYEAGRNVPNRTAPYYELKLAEVSVPTASTTVTDARITDTRALNSVCGFVSNLLQITSTEDLFLQWTTAFNGWFDNIKGQISDDEGVRIQLELDEHTESTILSHPGLHGLRYYNDELQVYDEENDEWVSAAPDQLRPTSIEKVSTSGTSETYKLTYSDGSFTTVTAPQGLLKGTCTGVLSANHTAVATLATSQFRNIKASTTDLTAGSSTLTSGDIYIVYE